MMSWLGHKNESNGGVYKDFEVKDIVFRCICIQLLNELPCDRIHYQRCSNRLVNERWRETDALSRWRGKFKVENEGQVGSGKSSERDLCPCNLTNSSESCWNSLLGLSLEIVSFLRFSFDVVRGDRRRGWPFLRRNCVSNTPTTSNWLLHFPLNFSCIYTCTVCRKKQFILFFLAAQESFRCNSQHVWRLFNRFLG